MKRKSPSSGQTNDHQNIDEHTSDKHRPDIYSSIKHLTTDNISEDSLRSEITSTHLNTMTDASVAKSIHQDDHELDIGLTDSSASSQNSTPLQPNLSSTLERMLSLLDETSTSLSEREQMFRALAETIPSPVFVHYNMKVIYANPAAIKFTVGNDIEKIIQKDVFELIHPDDLAKARTLAERKKEGQDISGHYNFRLRNVNGRYILHRSRMQKATYRGLDVMINVTTDLSKSQSLKKEIEKEKHYVRNVLDSITVPMLLTDNYGNITEFNHSAETFLGYTANTVRGENSSAVIQLVNSADHSPLSDPVLRALQENVVIKHLDNVLLQTSSYSNEFVEVEIIATPLYNQSQSLRGASLQFKRRALIGPTNEVLTYQATHDSLTGLINRREFETRLSKALDELHKGIGQHVLCYVDLNKFKPVNDTAGHQAGDEVLKQVAGKLKEFIRESDSVGRIGGDEFGILLHGCQLEKAEEIAQKICKAIESFNFNFAEQTFSIGIAVGMVVVDNTSASIASVLNAADTACYIAKESTTSAYHVFTEKDTMVKRDHSGAVWRRRIMEALTYNGFELFVQKIRPLSDASSVRALQNTESAFFVSRQTPVLEVNVRMIDQYGTMYRPELFLAAARTHGLLSSIDKLVVQNTFDAIAQGWIKLEENQCVSINLSAETFSDEEFLSAMIDALDEYQVDPRCLCFEVAEKDVVSNLAMAKRFIKVLNDLGCLFAIDDFGRELQSFSYLRELNVHYIKLDGFYIRSIENDEVNRAMVGAMIKLAHSLNMKVIAEQVESEGVLNVLAELGADLAQGEKVSPVVHLHDVLK